MIDGVRAWSEKPIGNGSKRRIPAFLLVVGIGAGVAGLVWETSDCRDAIPSASSYGVSPDSPPRQPMENPVGNEPIPQRAVDPPAPLWRFVDKPDTVTKPPYPAHWSKAGRVLVDVSIAAERASAWQVGDSIAMQLTQSGASHQGSIEQINDGPGNSRSARGMAIAADGTPRRFVVTVGPTRVLAYIDTDEGPYELVANTRLGWLVPSSSMLAGFDFSKPDYIVPEQRPVPEGPPP